MAKATFTKRELWSHLVHPQWGGPVVPVSVQLEIADNTNADLLLFAAPRDVAIRRASVAHETSPDGTTTYALRNLTDSEDLTDSDVDADGLSANTVTDFTIADTAEHIDEGDLVAFEYESTGTTSPDSVVVTLEVEFNELK